MIPPTRPVPVHHMAHRLSEHLPSERATPEAAMQLLDQMRYEPADIVACVFVRALPA